MNMLQSIHWLDASLVSVAAAGALVGAWRGVLRQTVRLVTYVISFYATLYLHDPVVEFIRAHLREVADQIPQLQSFLATWLASYLAVFAVTVVFQRGLKKLFLKPEDRQITTALDAVGLRPLDRWLGAGVGAVLATLLAGAGLFGLALQNDAQVEAHLAGSRLRPQVLRVTQAVLVAVPAEQQKALANAVEAAFVSVGRDVTAQTARQATEKIEKATEVLRKTTEAAQKPGPVVSPGQNPDQVAGRQDGGKYDRKK
jgi:uncharacterized membrane protein required for colicin V production